MPQPDHISKLGVPDPATLDEDLQVIWQKCVDKLGFVPNVFSTYSLKPQRLRNFMAMYNEIMLSDSGLSKLEREMIAVVVSSANRATTAWSRMVPRSVPYPAIRNLAR